MSLFEIKPRLASKLENSNLVKKAKPKAYKKSSNTILDLLLDVQMNVEENLSEYKDDYIMITNKADLDLYIENANKDGYLSIDTETTGLDPMLDKIVGLCLYSKNQKASYVPINHVDYITNTLLTDQVTEEEAKDSLDKFTGKIIMFNAAFDIRVLRNQLNVFYDCYWDCLLAAKLLNENEPTHGMKALYSKYISNKDDKSFTELFSKVLTFDKIPPQYAYLYGAHDAKITMDLFDFQHQFLNENQSEDLVGVYNNFMNVEMPVVKPVVDLEDYGIKLDLDFVNNYLKPKYEKISDEKLQICYDEIDKHFEEIEVYKLKNPGHGLSNPINIGSASQLSTIIYDIFKQPVIDKQKPRGTGEEILSKINTPFTKAILEYRQAQKLLNTYIYKIPELVYEDDRIRSRINISGAKTGRLSCNNPNLMAIPANVGEIRQMFVGGIDEREVNKENNMYEFSYLEEVYNDDKWVFVDSLQIGDKIDGEVIKNIEKVDHLVRIYV